MSGRLDGKVALITGAGRGIGRAIALKLASEGARLVINDLDTDPLEETAQLARDLGVASSLCPGSITAPGFADRFVQTAMGDFGAIDIIVNNAGYTWDSVIQRMSDEQFDAMIDVHLRAPFRILRAAADPLRQQAKADAAAGRRIVRKVVNISSTSAGGNPGQANYSSAKAGVMGLTRTLAKEWGRYAVTVNCVAFALVSTRLVQPLRDKGAVIQVEGREIAVGVQQARLDAAAAMIPMGRGGTPEEAAGAVYLFCSPESDYVSGQTIVCGGGHGSIG